jgi:hypothetical protein
MTENVGGQLGPYFAFLSYTWQVLNFRSFTDHGVCNQVVGGTGNSVFMAGPTVSVNSPKAFVAPYYVAPQ